MFINKGMDDIRSWILIEHPTWVEKINYESIEAVLKHYRGDVAPVKEFLTLVFTDIVNIDKFDN